MVTKDILHKIPNKIENIRVGLYLREDLVEKLKLLVELKPFVEKGATQSSVVNALIETLFEDNPTLDLQVKDLAITRKIKEGGKS